jgi:hypothetical protein
MARLSIDPVSITRLVKRSMRFSRTTLSWQLHIKAYVTYRSGATFGER